VPGTKPKFIRHPYSIDFHDAPMQKSTHLQLAELDPDGLAVDDFTRTRTWSELLDRCTRTARFLREDAGLEPDDHVAVLMENRVEIVELIIGGIMAGVWVTPINWHLAPDEVAYVVGDSEARVVFTDSGYLETAKEVAGDARVIEAGDEWDALLAAASTEPMPLDGPSGGNMIYTSGTTGRPKGVKRARRANVGAALDFFGEYGNSVGLDGSGPHLITGPMYHAAPLMFSIYDNANGAPIIIMPRWDERDALRIIVEREIAHLHMVPTMFVRLLRLPEEERARFEAPKLEIVLHGAAPVSVEVKKAMIDWFGEKLVEYWGATEGGVNTLIDSKEWLAHPGSVGRTLSAFEVFAVDENGKRLPPGEVGDLYCRHKHVDDVFEYHGDPEKTAGAYLEPGVFTIGDIGWTSEDGHVYLADRRSNMIISGGVNIYPREVEDALQQHSAISDVGVFGIPDDEWGESVKAAVELRPGYEASSELEAEILAFAREKLARYKVPRSIDFEERLPRESTGKLYIRRLRDRYWQGRERKI
jgi:long-chain acyl-CoA synthetase